MKFSVISALRQFLAGTTAAVLAACGGQAREQPGTIPNPLLAQMMEDALALELTRIEQQVSNKKMRPDAASQTRSWLQEVAEIVARCRHAPSDQSKFNLMEYDITLRTGERIENIYSGHNCAYWSEYRPLLMRVRLEQGRFADVLTDGRERKHPPAFFKNDAVNLVAALLKTGRARAPALYFFSQPSAADIAQQWKTKP